VYYQLSNELGANLPKPDLIKFAREITAVQAVIEQGFVLSAHDISDGGLIVALAEMCIASKVGVLCSLMRAAAICSIIQ